MSKERNLICFRVADRDAYVQSTIEACAMCNRPVWRALSSPTALRAICMQCAKTKMREHRIREHIIRLEPPTTAQLADIRKYHE
jgi:hypothetical protein